MHQVQAATRSLAANTEGQTGSARYNYVSGAKLLGVIRPLMDKLGLILTQEVVDIKNEPITYMTRNGEKTEMFTTAHIRFTWVDTDDGSQVVNDFFCHILGVPAGHGTAHEPYRFHFILVQKQVFSSGAGLVQAHCREDPHFGKLPV